MLRTEELAALHRFDGAEQYFTRAVDFGYSFSIDETFEKWGTRRDHRRLRAADPHDPSRRRSSRMPPDRQRRRPAPQGVGGASRAKPTSWPATRRSTPSRSRTACARGSRRSSITARLRLPRRADAPAGKLTRVNSARLRSRCSARPTRRSAPKRAACTSARAWRSCWRCRGRPRRDATSWSSRRSPASCSATRRRCSTASTPSIAGLAQFAGAAAAEGPDRRPRRDRRRGADRAEDSSTPTTTMRRGAAAARRACAPSASLRGQLRDDADRRRRRGSRSTSACARRSASSSRRSLLANGIRVEALADDGVVVPGQPVKVSRHRRQPRRGRGRRSSRSSSTASTGDARVHADGGHRRRRFGGGGGGRGGRGARTRRRRRRRCRRV